MAPATESIMGSLPRAKAGVGSAMNDTTRQVGGALGVAVVGSVMLSVYGARGSPRSHGLAPAGQRGSSWRRPARTSAPRSRSRPTSTCPAALQTKLVTQINEAFVAGMHRGVLFAAAATLIGVFIVFRYLPARGTEVDGIPAPTSPEEIEAAAVAGPAGVNGTDPHPNRREQTV